ncbi:SMI1 / KNR4 family (SUKH-1) [Selenomonas sp. WCT3]|uniref:SMI1/KNR4 family protein n=1 Tax=Selenomonas sp. WCT3 TaxID=3158785 RepID=UPI00088DC18B|nr:SMI1 / KNR4 family (SUKH-1) [Selenomonas ruminantium]
MYEKYLNCVHKNDIIKKDWGEGLVFFEIRNVENEIKYVEQELNFNLPLELKKLYNELGYGFISKYNDYYFNRFISPIEIYDFYKGNNEYENDERREYYPFDENNIIFYEVSETVFLTLKLDGDGVYYFDEKIAKSIPDFIEKMLRHHNYYIHQQ